MHSPSTPVETRMETFAGVLALPSRIVLKSRRVLIALTASLLTSAFAAMALVGWQIHNIRLLGLVLGFITMKANTAIAFLACSLALCLTLGKYRPYAAWPAVGAGLIGAATLFEYCRSNLGIDELFFSDPYSVRFPGRMAPITALNFMVFSLAMFLLSRGKNSISQLCCGGLGLSAFFAVLGYAYGVPFLYGSGHYTAMALHTGACFLALALGGLAAGSDGGLLALVWIEGPSTHLMRHLLPASVLVPASVGFVVLRNPVSRIDPRLAAALIVVFNIVLFSGMILRSALIVYRLQMDKQKAENLSQIDPLTQVLNRRGFELAVNLELMRWQRFKTPFSVVILDIDHFKSINDRHGHLMGDAVLQKLAAAWSRQVRGIDILARYGGEEFVVICLGTDAEGAFTLAEKLRETSLETSITEFGFAVSVSCGVASAGKDGSSRDALLHSADGALYKAKSDGRNRTLRAGSLAGVMDATAGVR
jgi:diguanylate cyclase (GGDEF)-like protein